LRSIAESVASRETAERRSDRAHLGRRLPETARLVTLIDLLGLALNATYQRLVDCHQ